MAAGTWTLYASARKKLVTGLIDLDTDVFRCRLYKGTAAASVSATAVSVVTEISAGGHAANTPLQTLANVDITAIAGSVTTKFTSDNIIFTASGGDISSAQYAVIYTSASSIALAWCKLSTGAFNVTSGNTLTITTPTNGHFVIY